MKKRIHERKFGIHKKIKYYRKLKMKHICVKMLEGNSPSETRRKLKKSGDINKCLNSRVEIVVVPKIRGKFTF